MRGLLWRVWQYKMPPIEVEGVKACPIRYQVKLFLHFSGRVFPFKQYNRPSLLRLCSVPTVQTIVRSQRQVSFQIIYLRAQLASLKQVSESFVDILLCWDFILSLSWERACCLGIHNADDTSSYSLAHVMLEDKEIRSKNTKGELPWFSKFSIEFIALPFCLCRIFHF